MEKMLDIKIHKDPIEGETGCGDTAVIQEKGGVLYAVLVDVLGHGTPAAELAEEIEIFLKDKLEPEPDKIIITLDEFLRGTRGAVAAVCCINPEENSILFSGIGNISAVIYGKDKRSLISRNGVLGYSIPTPKISKENLFQGDILIVCSDGIRDNIPPDDFPVLLEGTSSDIAEKLFANFRKNDDASCIVIRNIK